MENPDRNIKRILEGDTEPYAEIIREHEAKVRAVIAAMIPDRNMVADLTQEVFIIAYQRLSSYRPGTNFIAWLRTIARNVAQNERRRWYRRREMEKRYQVEISERIEENIDRIVDALPEDLLDSLRDCVDHLSGKTRALVDGFYFKEHAVRELASMLKLSINAAKVTLHRARQAIGNCLKKKGKCDV